MKSLVKTYLKFALKLALAFWLFSLFRVLFYLFNSSYFPEPEFINFLGGVRFDWMTITILYLPFFVSLWFYPRSNTILQKGLFLFSTALAILTNVLDFGYYNFTHKRTTTDLFTTKGLGEDVMTLLPQFAKDYWHLLVLAIICFFILKLMYQKIETIKTDRLNWKRYILFVFPITVLIFIGLRGGVQLKPLNVIQASQYANSQNIPLVLNTSFTLIKSFSKETIEIQHFFPDEELAGIYTPVQKIQSNNVPEKLNVVLIIAESFSQEYIGFYNDGVGYTPFLDSLMNESVVFINSFANGKKSIEALPAILSSIPTLSNRAYISSKYAGNTIESLPKTLKKEGYSSAFYHGGANGSMGFKAFTQVAGIEEYYGKEDYPNTADYDGNWGIFDEPYLQYCVEEFSNMQAPFFGGIFTLSSHHPYTIPKQHVNKFPRGDLPIHESIGYADHALRQFFKSAEKTTWFENTLFIITADHTQAVSNPNYNNRIGLYQVPIAYYCPKILPAKVIETVTQQTDIFPTTLDLIGFESKILSFGNSAFSGSKEFSVSYINGIYQLIKKDYCLHFDGAKVTGLFKWQNNNPFKENLMNSPDIAVQSAEKELSIFLKAYLQQYQSRMVSNNLTYE